jgi:hypothetical protein
MPAWRGKVGRWMYVDEGDEGTVHIREGGQHTEYMLDHLWILWEHAAYDWEGEHSKHHQTDSRLMMQVGGPGDAGRGKPTAHIQTPC